MDQDIDFPSSTIHDDHGEDDVDMDDAHQDAEDALYTEGTFNDSDNPYLPPEQLYDFRINARLNQREIFMSALDFDKTGDYDPKTEFKRARYKGCRLGTRREPQRDDEEREAELRIHKLTALAARVNDASLIISFPLNVQKIADITCKIPDHWAEDDPEKSDDLLLSETGLRPRRARQAEFEDESGSDAQYRPRILDPAGIELDLYGHPDARGCVLCRCFGERCSLLEDYDETRAYPCRACLDDNQPCELITQPTKKLTCETCKSKKLRCSYHLDPDGDHTQPCTYCQAQGHKCIAGPADGGLPERNSYGRDYTKVSQRKFINCTDCRRDGVKCSLQSKEDKPPCQRCKEKSQRCTFRALPRKPVVRKGPKVSGKQAAPKSLVLQEQSALIHSITFLDSDNGPCTWCTQPNYGIIGVDWRKGIFTATDSTHKSYTELKPDAAESIKQQPQSSSRMCIPCTASRLTVPACTGHILTTLPFAFKITIDLETDEEFYENNLDAASQYTRLYKNHLLPTDNWCSLCVSPAYFTCCTTQTFDQWGTPFTHGDPKARGCSLKLCIACRAAYNALGDLGSVLGHIRKEYFGKGAKTQWPLGPRADAGLLLQEGLFEDGLLFRAIRAGDGEE